MAKIRKTTCYLRNTILLIIIKYKNVPIGYFITVGIHNTYKYKVIKLKYVYIL